MTLLTQTRAKLLITFARIVELGGISAAARTMQMDKSAVSRQLRELETQLGVVLLRRNTQTATLTDIGQLVYERAQRLIAEVEGAGLEAESAREVPVGVLTVSTSVVFGKHQLVPQLGEFLRRYPEVDVELCLLDRFVHPTDEGFDVLLRVCDKAPDDLVAHHLAQINYALVATPELLQQGAPIREPADLAGRHCLFYGFKQRSAIWEFRRGEEQCSVQVSTRLSINSGEALREAALDGLGVALLPSFLVADDIRQGRLRPVLSDYEVKGTLGTALYALHLPGRLQSPKVRAFVQYVKQLWQSNAWDSWR